MSAESCFFMVHYPRCLSASDTSVSERIKTCKFNLLITLLILNLTIAIDESKLSSHDEWFAPERGNRKTEQEKKMLVGDEEIVMNVKEGRQGG